MKTAVITIAAIGLFWYLATALAVAITSVLAQYAAL